MIPETSQHETGSGCPTPTCSRLEDAFRALWQFCECELGWEFFRAEFEISDDPRQTLQNANKLREYLREMKAVPVVAECLGANEPVEGREGETPESN